jgi:hypothetical protein
MAAIAGKHPDAGLGVVGGFGGLVPIDIDTEDQTFKRPSGLCSARFEGTART